MRLFANISATVDIILATTHFPNLFLGKLENKKHKNIAAKTMQQISEHSYRFHSRQILSYQLSQKKIVHKTSQQWDYIYLWVTNSCPQRKFQIIYILQKANLWAFTTNANKNLRSSFWLFVPFLYTESQWSNSSKFIIPFESESTLTNISFTPTMKATLEKNARRNHGKRQSW